jgi:ribonuclease HI
VGEYRELTLSDTWEGVLHCTRCNVKVERLVALPPRFIIYADGACKANGVPGGGRGGWGAVIRDADQVTLHELSGAEPGTTNNRMEILAVIKALEKLPKNSEAEVWTDSQYVVKGMTEWMKGWKRRDWMKPDGSGVLNYELWQALDDATGGHRVSWHWVRGHSGHEGNEHADRLAQAAAETLKR